MKQERLKTEDFIRASKRLGLDPATVMAVDDIESRGSGHYEDGRPTILYEAHVFSRLTGGKYNKSHPHISSPKWNRSLYGSASAKNQYARLNEAMTLDREAAMKSCSWGRFQIMGFNHEASGFKTVDAFVCSMTESEVAQLDAFVSFMEHNNLAKYLRDKDWRGFARRYNGAGYEQNDYHNKLRRSYEKFSRILSG